MIAVSVALLFLVPLQIAWSMVDLTQWTNRMKTDGQTVGNRLAAVCAEPTPNPDNVYYDGIRVFQQVVKYIAASNLSDPLIATFNGYRDQAVCIFRDRYVIPNGGSIPGYRNYTGGLRRHFEDTGAVMSKDAALSLFKHADYSDSWAMTLCAPPPDLYCYHPSVFSREVALAIIAYRNAQQLGYIWTTVPDPDGRPAEADYYADLVNTAYDHINQWLTLPPQPYDAPPNTPGGNRQAFMMSLTAHALVMDFQYSGDARLIPALTQLADRFLNTANYSTSGHGWPESYDVPCVGADGSHCDPAPDLNNLIAPTLAFLYWKTSTVAYRTMYDTAFADGVQYADWAFDGKHYDQQLMFGMQGVNWRA